MLGTSWAPRPELGDSETKSPHVCDCHQEATPSSPPKDVRGGTQRPTQTLVCRYMHTHTHTDMLMHIYSHSFIQTQTHACATHTYTIHNTHNTHIYTHSHLQTHTYVT